MAEKTFSTFQDIPCTPKQHFVMHLYAAICLIINTFRRMSDPDNNDLENLFQKYPFLTRYFGEIVALMPPELTWEKTPVWWEAHITIWEQQGSDSLPLCRLSQNGRLSFNGRLALMIAGLVEEDARFGDLFADMQVVPQRRPCLEFIGHMLSEERNDSWQICRPLLQQQLLFADNQAAPRSEWALRVPAVLWDCLRGDDLSQLASTVQYTAPETLPALSDLVLPDAFRQQLARLPTLIQSGETQTIILRGSPGSDGQHIMGAIARLLNRGVVMMRQTAIGMNDTQAAAPIGPLCHIIGALPVIIADVGPGETAVIPQWPGYDGPLGILLGLEGGIDEQHAGTAVSLTIPQTRLEQRHQQWRHTLNGTPVDNLDLISERFHLPNGYIRQVATMAQAQAAIEKHNAVDMHHIQSACRLLNRQHLDTLATRLVGGGSWMYLAVNDLTMEKLMELERRCCHRERLLAQLGPAFGTSQNRGVRALFTGSSGTGKTLAARILAAELGMDIYRIDLAAVVNKYIGETEKNLHRVLTEAEALDVILLLDEGDALLGNRTEVRSANDRYANLETDYLLQRLEQYQGIVFITTNTAENIDGSFQRRMDVVVNFVAPQAEERWQIWQFHLPQTHQVTTAYLEEVAIRCEMTGGQIRNAALHATLLALDDNESAVTAHHLQRAIQSEYRKAGMIDPMKNGRAAASPNGMAAFLESFVES